MYITDWFSTILHLAGVPPAAAGGAGEDSYNMWPAISRGERSPRREVVLNMDRDEGRGTWSAAIRVGRWKLIWGQEYLLKRDQHEKAGQLQLFDIKKDPGETVGYLK